jgi:hypothetical protein
MKKKIKPIIILSLVFVFSCHSYTKQDLKVIDNLLLGLKVNDFYKACDSIGLENKLFVTRTVIKENDTIRNFALRYYCTDKFNLTEYHKRGQDHLGLFYLTTLAGTDNIFKLNVLLIHTEPPIFASSFLPESYKDSMAVLSQDVNELLIEEIKNLFLQKYETPKQTITGNNVPIKVIIKNEVIDFMQGPTDDGIMYVWETQALIIKYFTGIKNPKNWYSKENRDYWKGYDPITKLSEGDFHCRFGAYISYEVKDEALKKLNLDKISL